LLFSGTHATVAGSKGLPPRDVQLLSLSNWAPKLSPITAAFSTTTAVAFGISELSDAEKVKRGLSPSSKLHYCQANGILFSVEARLEVLTEVQSCRLISYLCTFDTRVKPLLMVIRYWAKVNGIRLAKPLSSRRQCDPPDPAVLDWLVIFFLTNTNKILPTPRQLGELPHPQLLLEKTDIAFSEDESFARKFSSYSQTNQEAHILNVFNLTTQFFRFYCEELLLQERKIVLNLRDGEVIPVEDFVGEISKIPTKLTMTERKMARTGRIQNPEDVIILHPLFLSHRFSFCNKTFVTSIIPKMAQTSNKLTRELENYKGDRANEIRIRDALKLKVN